MAIRMLDVEFRTEPNGAVMCWMTREIDHPDGTTGLDIYSFPAEIFDIRSAEYDIPREDMDTLLEVIMYECELSSAESQVLWYSDDVAQARELYLDAIARKRAEHDVRKDTRPAAARKAARQAADAVGKAAEELDDAAAARRVRERLEQRCSDDAELRELIVQRREIFRASAAGRRRRARPVDPTTVPDTEPLKAQLRAQLARGPQPRRRTGPERSTEHPRVPDRLVDVPSTVRPETLRKGPR